jgi:ubiquinone/menaquinone biosynthesis C-methylase UbiE
MNNLTEQEVKQIVKEGYTKRINQGSSCCGGSITENITDKMKGTLVKIAGYSSEELKSIPSDAVENSFGCGNPLAFAGVKEGQTVLDIGSGAGIDCFIASKKVGPKGKVIGIDMTPAMIEKARENARKSGITNVEFKLGDADNIPVENSSVDWVISNCVINLAPDKDKVFKEIYRILKPGGNVSISDIVVSQELPDKIVNDFQLLIGCIAGAIKESDYLEKMRNAGLENVQVINRLVYESSQIENLFGSDEGCCGGEAPLELKKWMKELNGKIWSAKIVARKPITL